MQRPPSGGLLRWEKYGILKTLRTRLVSIDLLRSFAIISMIVYHLAYDLERLHGVPTLAVIGRTPDLLWARATAIMFLLLVGVSFHLSSEGKAAPAIWRRQLRRSAVVLGCALLVSLATYLFDPATYVRFGILHCIGLSLLILPFIRNLGPWNILLGLTVIAAPNVLTLPPLPSLPSLPSFLTLPFGILPPNFTTIDYFPLLPWTGVIILGLGLAPLFIRLCHSIDALIAHSPQLKALSLPGRHSLLLYMIHQPVLVGVLWVMFL
ncbi:MAG: hypothetical protein G01um101425_985 [Candidatus Peregrinibacteria bacterium Gr01-1014_25]|nr:MAG: hypothetical protein G01um101425_985 [Candidatus Peregrinibacteria bacterium Gr01-1014_25]